MKWPEARIGMGHRLHASEVFARLHCTWCRTLFKISNGKATKGRTTEGQAGVMS